MLSLRWTPPKPSSGWPASISWRQAYPQPIVVAKSGFRLMEQQSGSIYLIPMPKIFLKLNQLWYSSQTWSRQRFSQKHASLGWKETYSNLTSQILANNGSLAHARMIRLSNPTMAKEIKHGLESCLRTPEHLNIMDPLACQSKTILNMYFSYYFLHSAC